MEAAIAAGPNYVAALLKLEAWRAKEAQKERKEQKA